MNHRLVCTAAAAGFWLIAALLVLGIDHVLIRLIAISFCAFACMRVAGRSTTVEQALLIGATWFALSIAADSITAHSMSLAGETSGTRALMFCGWAFAPALFARCS